MGDVDMIPVRDPGGGKHDAGLSIFACFETSLTYRH
jgi:hypothetical protein